jgi:hypothetical protein
LCPLDLHERTGASTFMMCSFSQAVEPGKLIAPESIKGRPNIRFALVLRKDGDDDANRVLEDVLQDESGDKGRRPGVSRRNLANEV